MKQVWVLLLLCAPISGRAASTIVRDGNCPATAATSCTFSKVTGGGLMLIFAYRNASTTAPSLPSGSQWVSIATSTGGTINSWRLGCRKAHGTGDKASGTWTNATNVVGISYSNTAIGGSINCNSLAIGGNAQNNGSSTSMNCPTITMSDSSGASWVACFEGNNAASGQTCTPSGMSSVSASGAVGAFDTNGGVTSWPSTTCTVTTGHWRTVVVEIKQGLAIGTGLDITTGSVYSQSNTKTATPAASSYNCRFANTTGAGNLNLVFVTWAVTTSVTATVSDDMSQSYTQGVDSNDTHQHVQAYYFPNSAAGVLTATLTFSGGVGTAQFVGCWGASIPHVATSSPVDGGGCVSGSNGGGNSSIATSSITTTQANDVIFQYVYSDDQFSNTADYVEQGANPWDNLSSDEVDQQYVQWDLQAAAGAITPTMYEVDKGGNSAGWNTVACAFKTDGTKGTPNTATPRIFSIQSVDVETTGTTISKIQWPTRGNFFAMSLVTTSGYDINGNVTDSNGNTWAHLTNSNQAGSGDSGWAYAINPTPDSTMGALSIPMTCTSCSGSSTLKLYDFIGADTVNPIDTSHACTGDQTTMGDLTTCGITTSQANEVVVGGMGINSQTITGCSAPTGCLIESTTYGGEMSPDFVDADNGWAGLYAASAGATGNFVFQNTAPSGVQQWNLYLLAVKGPASASTPSFNKQRRLEQLEAAAQ